MEAGEREGEGCDADKDECPVNPCVFIPDTLQGEFALGREEATQLEQDDRAGAIERDSHQSKQEQQGTEHETVGGQEIAAFRHCQTVVWQVFALCIKLTAVNHIAINSSEYAIVIQMFQ